MKIFYTLKYMYSCTYITWKAHVLSDILKVFYRFAITISRINIIEAKTIPMHKIMNIGAVVKIVTLCTMNASWKHTGFLDAQRFICLDRIPELEIFVKL